jgi:hypothetical protein
MIGGDGDVELLPGTPVGAIEGLHIEIVIGPAPSGLEGGLGKLSRRHMENGVGSLRHSRTHRPRWTGIFPSEKLAHARHLHPTQIGNLQ